MNTYFYSVRNCQCNGQCHYQTCSNRCRHLINKLEGKGSITPLPIGSGFNTLETMSLRSGDILILYAETDTDIRSLLRNKDVFEAYRVILIAGQDSALEYGDHHFLRPRYTTTLERDISGLEAVLNKMTA